MSESKTLVLFYSMEGSTRKVGEYISSELGLPSEEIRLEEEKNPKGLVKFIWGGSQVLSKKKPPIKPIEADLDKYDTIILGSPVWAGSYTPAIRTLMEDEILKDKDIAFFYTSLGGPGKVEENMRELTNINNNLLSAYGMVGVKKNFDKLKSGVLDWAKKFDS